MQNPNNPPAKDLMRWLNILFRTAHIGTAAILFGGTILGVVPGQLTVWLTVTGGTVLLILECLNNQSWPHRGMALMVYAHVLFAILAQISPGIAVPLFWAVLITGCIGSHMPRKYRHWSILYGPEQKKS